MGGRVDRQILVQLVDEPSLGKYLTSHSHRGRDRDDQDRHLRVPENISPTCTEPRASLSGGTVEAPFRFDVGGPSGNPDLPVMVRELVVEHLFAEIHQRLIGSQRVTGTLIVAQPQPLHKMSPALQPWN